ncbi:MAG: CinA family protein [bacterium]|nr:CinA family protein [bacterium]
MNLSKELARILKEKKLTISVVESCTGGLIQKLITDTAGSSEYFLGGVVAYSNKLKEKLIGVKHTTLLKYGAVSKETSVELANGITKITGSNIGISTTGIAGPGGGTKDKPVGLIYIGIRIGKKTTSYKYIFKGTREQIRKQTAEEGLKKVIEIVKKVKV